MKIKDKRKRVLNKRFRTIKPEIRILGIDDAPFTPHSREKVLIVGTVFRAGIWLDGVLSTHITVDGDDATEKIIEMVNFSRHKDQLGVIMLDGVTFGGFNVVDVQQIYELTGIPVIVVMRKIPDFKRIRRALKRFSDYIKRWNRILIAGKVYLVQNSEDIFIQIQGISLEDAEKIVQLSSTRSSIPEPIRVAHLIASGVTTGESKGSA